MSHTMGNHFTRSPNTRSPQRFLNNPVPSNAPRNPTHHTTVHQPQQHQQQLSAEDIDQLDPELLRDALKIVTAQRRSRSNASSVASTPQGAFYPDEEPQQEGHHVNFAQPTTDQQPSQATSSQPGTPHHNQQSSTQDNNSQQSTQTPQENRRSSISSQTSTTKQRLHGVERKCKEIFNAREESDNLLFEALDEFIKTRSDAYKDAEKKVIGALKPLTSALKYAVGLSNLEVSEVRSFNKSTRNEYIISEHGNASAKSIVKLLLNSYPEYFNGDPNSKKMASELRKYIEGKNRKSITYRKPLSELSDLAIHLRNAMEPRMGIKKKYKMRNAPRSSQHDENTDDSEVEQSRRKGKKVVKQPQYTESEEEAERNGIDTVTDNEQEEEEYFDSDASYEE